MRHPATAPQPPKYWTFEPPELGEAVQAYMAGEDLTVRGVALMRASKAMGGLAGLGRNPYETDGGRQWLAKLRERVRAIASPDDIAQALSIMKARRMDPLQFPSGQTAREFSEKYRATQPGNSAERLARRHG
jgi:hypothetical protein